MKQLLTNFQVVIPPATASGVTAILVEDGCITGLLNQADIDTLTAGNPAGVDIVDLGGNYLMCGLIDSHAHLGYTPQPGTPSSLNYTHSLEFNTVVAVRNARTYLKHGFTGVMDVGARGSLGVALRDGVSQGLIPGPEVIASGPVISSTGGLMNDQPSWVQFEHPNGVAVSGPDQMRDAVRAQILSGVDNIKLGATGQLSRPTSTTQLLTHDEMCAAVETAEAHGKTVIAHVYGEEAVAACIRAGIHGIQHGFGGLSTRNLELLSDSESYLVPTVGVFDRALREGLPVDWTEEKKSYLQRAREQLAEAMTAIAGTDLADRVLVGSDSGNNTDQATAGTEVQALAEYGFGMEAALKSATVNPGRVLPFKEKRGELAVGYRADFAVFRDSPLLNPETLWHSSSVTHVFKRGELLFAES